MIVNDVMSPKVCLIDPMQPIREAARMLAASSVVKRVRFTVVSGGGKSPRKIRTARAPGHRPEGRSASRPD